MTSARAVAEARRAVHETFTSLPAWDADKARESLTRLEAAIERHIREQVAQDIEGCPFPIEAGADFTWWDSRDRDHAAWIARGADTTRSTR